MLTNADRKLIKSLDSTKWRSRERLFKAEGTKCVIDTLNAFTLNGLYATSAWLNEHSNLPSPFSYLTEQVTRADLERMTSLTTAPEVIAVYEIPDRGPVPVPDRGMWLALDAVRDPGNLGTIIRLADWFALDGIIASGDTADCWNPKVVQATMGSIGRVPVWYADDLAATLKASGLPVMGTFMNGDNVFTADLPRDGILVVGNEGHGISETVQQACTHRLTIPSSRPGAESLNVAVATAILASQLRARS